MKKNRISITTKAIIILVVFLIIAYVIFGSSIITKARDTLKDNIQARMLDTAKIVASDMDGDALQNITGADRRSSSYKSIKNKLLSLKNNSELQDIYILLDKGDFKYVFCIDSNQDAPAEFGEETVTTQALIRASKGTPSVDEEPYEDRWGRFYSAYAPVYNTRGEITGIVGVDFNEEWYESQISEFVFSITYSGIISLIIGGLLVFMGSSYVINRLREANKELVLLGDDIEELASQLNVSNNTDSNLSLEQSDLNNANSNDEVAKISDRIHNMRHEIEIYVNRMHAEAINMINALAKDYRSVYYVNLDEDDGICYRSHELVGAQKSLKEGEHFPYIDTFKAYADLYVEEEYKERFLEFIKPDQVKEGLKENSVTAMLYIAHHNGKAAYEKLKYADARSRDSEGDGEIHAVSVGIVDVTEETKATLNQNQALSDALALAEEASKAKTSFLSNMSHEIRTPMNAIISIGSIALTDPDISDKTRDYLSKINVSAKHLLKIINDILDMSRIEAGRMTIKSERFSMTDLIEQINAIVESQCNDRGLRYVNTLDPGLKGNFIGDPIKLKQVLINILGNAVKYTEPNGTVTLKVEKIVTFNNKTTMKFIISDTGVGMDPEFIPKVFEAFSQEDVSATSKNNSTGLGMAITKNIVEMMNGEITVESTKNVGSTFTVTLTFMEVEDEEDKWESINTSDLSALMVTDNVVSGSYVSIELGNVGITVDLAEDGLEAVEKVRLREARNDKYDVVIVDREMIKDDYMSVITALRNVSSYEKLVFALIAYQFSDIADKVREAGVNVLVSKPITAQVFMDKFSTALNSKMAVSKVVDLSGRHILLAEDKEINSEIITMVLQMKDMVVDVAANGKIAVDMYSEKEEGYYDAILMDMRMPEMDGITATGIIRKMGRSDSATIPIIALTANAFDEDVERSLQAGLNAHLTKPLEPDVLFDTLRRLIKE